MTRSERFGPGRLSWFACGAVLTVLLPAAEAVAVPPAATQPTTRPACVVRVDPRVELMSVIFHLAGHPEYNKPRVASYRNDVAAHFGPYRKHPVVGMARLLRARRGVSYDAPMSLAVHVSNPPALALRPYLGDRPVALDGRWRTDERDAFLASARDFAAVAKFGKFFAAHAAFYRGMEADMRRLLATTDLGWFDRFFGAAPGAKFVLCLAPLNGPSCYGPRYLAAEGSELYSILGVWQTDAQGKPLFNKSALPTLIHEFAHSYVNPIVYRHRDVLAGPCKTLFARHEKQMRRMAYGNWETLANETIVRASVVRYLAAHEGAKAAARELIHQHLRGFAWTNHVQQALVRYEQQRDKFARLEDYVPHIAKALADYAAMEKKPGS